MPPKKAAPAKKDDKVSANFIHIFINTKYLSHFIVRQS